MTVPQRPNQRWSLDFVSDSLAWGRRFRVLCIINHFSQEFLGAIVNGSNLGCGDTAAVLADRQVTGCIRDIMGFRKVPAAPWSIPDQWPTSMG